MGTKKTKEVHGGGKNPPKSWQDQSESEGLRFFTVGNLGVIDDTRQYQWLLQFLEEPHYNVPTDVEYLYRFIEIQSLRLYDYITSLDQLNAPADCKAENKKYADLWDQVDSLLQKLKKHSELRKDFPASCGIQVVQRLFIRLRKKILSGTETQKGRALESNRSTKELYKAICVAHKHFKTQGSLPNRQQSKLDFSIFIINSVWKQHSYTPLKGANEKYLNELLENAQ